MTDDQKPATAEREARIRRFAEMLAADPGLLDRLEKRATDGQFVPVEEFDPEPIALKTCRDCHAPAAATCDGGRCPLHCDDLCGGECERAGWSQDP